MHAFIRRYSSWIAICGLAVMLACWWAGFGPGLSQTRYNRIKIGMTPAEVRRIIGRPSPDEAVLSFLKEAMTGEQWGEVREDGSEIDSRQTEWWLGPGYGIQVTYLDRAVHNKCLHMRHWPWVTRARNWLGLKRLNADYHDNMLAAWIRAKQQHARSEDSLKSVRLTEAWQSWCKQIAKTMPRALGGIISPRPSPGDVLGQVLQADYASGLVLVSIGTDQGIDRGKSLEVYRVKPRPEYIGTITILDGRCPESVARPVPPLHAGLIRQGDIVATRIVTGR